MSQGDEFGRHEILDRASILGDLFDSLLVGRGGLKPEENKLVKKIAADLRYLYLLIGQSNG